MSEEKKELVKKFKVAPFLNIGTSAEPKWVRIRNTTSFDLSLNPETQDFEYIADEMPTTELLRYKPSLSLPITMYKGDADYALAFDKFYNLKTGEDAKAELLIVFFAEKSTETYTEAEEEKTRNVYKAWKTNSLLSVQSFNSVDSTITVQTDFCGTLKRGTVRKVDGVITFIEDETDEANNDDALTW